MAIRAEKNYSDTLQSLARKLESGAVTASGLVEDCLARIAAKDGEGNRCFLERFDHLARGRARWVDDLRRTGARLPAVAGIPVSIKDNFDIAGQVTTAGSKVLEDAAPAVSDAAALYRLKAAGMIPVGRTNMTEFAFSGLGINEHFGTPANPFDRDIGRIPGGSTSGGAVSVTDGMAAAAIGTDTGGSCRIPAALCGLVGFKSTSGRIPCDGVFPLAPSLDTVGCLGRSVACCAIVDDIMAGGAGVAPEALPLERVRLAVPLTLAFDDLEPGVEEAVRTAIGLLEEAGASITELELPELADLADINSKGGFSAAECHANLRSLTTTRPEDFDPHILRYIDQGAEQSSADYLDMVRKRAAIIDAVDRQTIGIDALLMPTTVMTAPTFESLADAETYDAINRRILRNPFIANLLDRCAISVPCGESGGLPVGLSLVGYRGGDRHLFAIAAAVEAVLRPVVGSRR